MRWMEFASCRGMETNIFFPTRGEEIDIRLRKVCADCTVKEECLQDALKEEIQIGFRGGLSAKKRRIMIQDQRHALRKAS